MNHNNTHPRTPASMPSPLNLDYFTCSPITAPILSLASHPEFIVPLSAVLKAGPLPPGQRYSSSPTIAKLSTLLSRSQKTSYTCSSSSSASTFSSSHLTSQKDSHLFNHSSSVSLNLDHSSNSMARPNFLNMLFDVTGKPCSSITSRPYAQSPQSDILNIDLPPQIKSTSQATSSSSTTTTEALTTNELTTELPEFEQLINDFDEPDSFMKPKYPLVLCHGLFGFDVLGPQALGLSYFRGVREALEQRDVEVYVAKVPSIASIEERARTLAQFIETRLPGKTVNLIGHSMGGLDSRFMITHLKPTSFKVASLTTIATPHRGSAFADHVMLDMIGTENLPKLLQMTTALGIEGAGQAFEDLTVKNMAKFNDMTPDDPNVTYYSYGAIFKPTFSSLFRVSWQIIYEREGDNDGLVSLTSAKWANYQGTLNNVNHADLVGWTEPWRTITHPNGKTVFKVIPFYLKVIDSLARNGF